MNPFRPILIAVLIGVACNRTAPKSEHLLADSAVHGVTMNTPVPGAATESQGSDDADELYRPTPDLNNYSWRFPTMNHGNERFTGQHLRDPSGMLVLWFDTATRATEDTPAGTTHVDSLVVSGLQPGEFLSYYCNADGRQETWITEIVGILRDTVNYARPRMAWMLDTSSYRIKAIPTDQVLCSVADLFPEPGDH